MSLRSRLRAHAPQLMIVVVAAALCAVVVRIVLSPRDNVDFLAYYGAGLAVLRHETGRVYDVLYIASLQQPWLPDPDTAYPYLYLPVFLPLFVPLALLPIKLARVLWAVLSFAALAAAVRPLRAFSGQGRAVPAVLPFLLVAAPLGQALLLGQMTPFLLPAIAGLAYLQWRGRPGWTAGLLAGVLLLKPFFLLPLAVLWALRKEWRALAGLSAAAAVATAGSYLVSPEATRAYFANRSLIPILGFAGVQENGLNATLYGELLHVLAEPLAQAAAGLALVAIVCAVAWAWRRPLTPYHHAAFWLALLLASPYLGHYDMALVAVPLAFLIPLWHRDGAAFLASNLFWLGSIVAAFTLRMWPMVFAVAILFLLCAARALSGAAGYAAVPTGAAPERDGKGEELTGA